MPDDSTVRAGAADTIDAAHTHDGLGIIGTPCHCENKGADGKGGNCQHSHGYPPRPLSLMEPRPLGTHSIAKQRPTYDIPRDVNANVMTFHPRRRQAVSTEGDVRFGVLVEPSCCFPV